MRLAVSSSRINNNVFSKLLVFGVELNKYKMTKSCINKQYGNEGVQCTALPWDYTHKKRTRIVKRRVCMQYKAQANGKKSIGKRKPRLLASFFEKQ